MPPARRAGFPRHDRRPNRVSNVDDWTRSSRLDGMSWAAVMEEAECSRTTVAAVAKAMQGAAA